MSTPRGKKLVRAGEALRGGLGDADACRREGVDAREQLLPLFAPGWIAEAIRRVEGRDGETPGVPQREVREARQPGVVPVDDVEPVGGERELEVGPGADGNAEAAPPGDGDRRAHRHDALEGTAVVLQASEAAAAGAEVGRPVRGREHDDVVPPAAQVLRRAGHVLVDRMGLRPGERRHHADAQAHRAIVGASAARFVGGCPRAW